MARSASLLLVIAYALSARQAAVEFAFGAGPCGPPVINPVACENTLPGNPSSEWDVIGGGDPSLQGFATDISYSLGETVHFKINTTASSYRLDVYRLGYYGGNGARKIATVNPSVSLPQNQPSCLTDSATQLVDCGNWAESASFVVPSAAVSGIYIARLVRPDTGGSSHVTFVVRNDAGPSDLLYQTSDASWQAYNEYGGNSLYTGNPKRASKVSYNRPLSVRGTSPRSGFFADEYPLVRWLEANGYDVSYSTDVDSDRRGALILQHRIFVSSGHDEYWSGGQRANVVAARDAGVNLAFMSGNEIFWKTRWEPSIDGTNTGSRTLVCYKESFDLTANRDPQDPPTWTGTWRDPRGSPPADGGRPENALSGTSFAVQNSSDSIVVPAEDGKMRFWRNTSVATLSPGSVATLPVGTLGYEWDEDPDNGSRPAGLIHLSSTTLNVGERLIGYGSATSPGTATHHVTLYRAASGALVLGAGTLRWSWGLDATHDTGSSTPDIRMKQATVNLFADMGAQPATLEAGLVGASKSSDAIAPTSTITSPSAGATVIKESNVTITGTAADTGGVVGGVEVSTNGGSTWHAATGRNNWSYTWVVGGYGPVTIKSRATDDSGNIEVPSAGMTVNVACPCKIFADGALPGVGTVNDPNAVELGVKFRADVAGSIHGIRFYKGSLNTGMHTGSIWSAAGTRLATATFSSESAAGWQQVNFGSPVAVSAGTTYVASYHTATGYYSADGASFATSGIDNPPLHALRDGVDGGDGVYRYGVGGFPNTTYNATNYWIDVVFTDKVAGTGTPQVVGTSPAAGATGVSASTNIAATFSAPVQSATIGFTLRDPANNAVTGSQAYDPATLTATFTPAAALSASSTYTAMVSGAKDLAGDTMNPPVSWSFTTSVPSATCPCSIWSSSTVPGASSVADPNAVELGVKFHADVAGSVNAVRFYKGSTNTGTHTGSLWSANGSLLASATFSRESASGWQQVNFGAPVAISAGVTYVASYHTNVGHYAYDGAYFATSGVDSSPLHGLMDGVDSGNGVYAYGAGGFPAAGGSANYWVDVVFNTSAPDITPPTVVSETPVAGTTGVSVLTNLAATFSEPVQSATIGFTLKDPASSTIAGSQTYDPAALTLTFTPIAALAPGTAYTASVSGTKDTAGNTMTPVSWLFTTAAPPAICPCSIWSSSTLPGIAAVGDPNSVELGVKFRADVAGVVSGIRFYKGSSNTGTHTGSLWSATGTRLATGTFSGESASGWQQLTFGSPVAIAANTTYVASYHASVGHYAYDGGYFVAAGPDSPPLHALKDGADGGDGVYVYGGSGFPTASSGSANYWVDVAFNTATPKPTFVGDTPAPGATAPGLPNTVPAAFIEAVRSGAIGFALQDAASKSIKSATTAYSSTAQRGSPRTVAGVSSTRATIRRVTDIPADLQIEYGTFERSARHCDVQSVGT